MNRPTSRRRKRPPWASRLVSWTAAAARREHERDAANTDTLVASTMLLLPATASIVFAVMYGWNRATLPPGIRNQLAHIVVFLLASILPVVLFWSFSSRLTRWAAARPRWSPPDEIRARHGMVLALWAAMIVALFAGFVIPGETASWVSLLLPMNFLGVWLVLSGLRRRVGRDERCRRCEYPTATPRWSRGLCTECGADLDSAWGVVLGHTARSWGRIGLGVLMLGAGVLLMVLGARNA